VTWSQPCDASGVLHHVSIEVNPDYVERSIALFELLGFARVPAPEPVSPLVPWLERGGTQIHLIHTPEATAPPLGHPGVVASDFEAAVQRVRGAGFEVEDADELWGEPRAFALMPGGGRVELMAAPPPPVSG
jgi:catechol 2,3-dioxygenase-like lactoylglutathione lyase family enzyme